MRSPQSRHTDLWQRTYYHFRNDNAPVLQMETEEKYFSFIVKTEFTDSHHRFDQCGIVMYLDSENWVKGSIEYENEQFQHLGSVVTTTDTPTGRRQSLTRPSNPCGTVSAEEKMTIVSSAPPTAYILIRCVSAICTRAAERFSSASMPALRKTLPLPPYLRI